MRVARTVAACVHAALLAGVPAAAIHAQEPPAWRLIYAVDSTGRRTQGDKAQLLRAVRAGQAVRVGWGVSWRLPDGTAGGVEHVAPAVFLTIHHEEVFAQLAPIMGQTPSAREPAIALRTTGGLWYALLDTTGRLVGAFAGDTSAQTVRTATYWYVEGSAGPAPDRLR
jgi:hypothetical protein